jgi:hypothetical protein
LLLVLKPVARADVDESDVGGQHVTFSFLGIEPALRARIP